MTLQRWRAHGLDCAVAQGFTLCGYILVPKGHPDANSWYDDVDVDVHGGLTFCQRDTNGGMWFGFDTGHYCDWMPSVPEAGVDDKPGRIWTVDDVANETEQLAAQLAARSEAS